MIDARLNIRTMKLADLKPAKYNPRRIDDAAMAGLEQSMTRFGVVEPIIFNAKSGVVVGGHQRLKVLRSQKIAETDVVIVDLDDIEEKALNVALNNPHIAGTFDPDMLVTLLEEIGRERADLFAGLRLGEILESSLREDAAHVGYDGEPTGIKLSDTFGVPPFSVLDCRQGYWLNRKKQWLELGMDSHAGRERNLLTYSSIISTPTGPLSGTSTFDPVLCELAYRWFCPTAGSVLDPFAGGSVRGIVAGRLGYRYTGIDLSLPQVTENRKQAERISCVAQPTWIIGDSNEIGTLTTGLYDFVLSCPPYGDLEKYSDDPLDLSNMAHARFVESYRGIIASTCSMLRDDRFACFVVGDYRNPKTGHYRDFVSQTIDAFRDAGLALVNHAILLTSQANAGLRAARIFNARRFLIKTHQDVLVFVKGDVRAAADATKGAAMSFGSLDANESDNDESDEIAGD